MQRQFTLDELIAINVMLNERRTLQARGQNIPGREHYLQRFGNRFKWRPSIERIADMEMNIQRDPIYYYQGAGRTWSTETRVGSHEFTQQESDLFTIEFLEFEQQQQAINTTRQEPIAHQAMGK